MEGAEEVTDDASVPVSMEADDVKVLYSKLTDICKQLEQKGEKVVILTSSSKTGSQEAVPENTEMLTKFQQFCEESEVTGAEIRENAEADSVVTYRSEAIVGNKHTRMTPDNSDDDAIAKKPKGQDIGGNFALGDIIQCKRKNQIAKVTAIGKFESKELELTQRRSSRIQKKMEIKVSKKVKENKKVEEKKRLDTKKIKTIQKNAQLRYPHDNHNSTDIFNSEDKSRDFVENAAIDTVSNSLLNQHVKREKESTQAVAHDALVSNPSDIIKDVDEKESREPNRGESMQPKIKCDKCGAQFSHANLLTTHQRKISKCQEKTNLASEVSDDYNVDVLTICYTDVKNNRVKVPFTEILNSQDKMPFKCIVCKGLFSRKSNFKRHLIKHSNYVIPACYICGVKLKSRDTLSKHLKDHNERPWQCDQCSKHRFDSIEALHVHLEKCSKVTEKDLTCETCGHVSKCRAALQIHENIHLGLKPFACDLCGKKMANSSSLERHIMAMHQDETPYKCQICNKAFRVRDNYKRHMKRHEEPKYKCEICGKCCFEFGNLKKHMMTHTKEKPFVCEICGSRYSRKSLLENHRRLHTGEKPFTCTEKDCGKSFRSHNNLRQHRRYHSDAQPYVCEVCGKAFKQPGRMSHHRKSHFNEYRWPCAYCTEKFKSLYVYKGHLAREHPLMKDDIERNKNIKLHQCDICQKVFGESADLQRHIFIHKGLKPYHCKYCSKAFNDKSNLKQHTKLHLDVRKYVCEICNKAFVLQKVLRSHIRNTHGQTGFSDADNKTPKVVYKKNVVTEMPVTYHVDAQFNLTTAPTHVIVEKEPSAEEVITIIPQHIPTSDPASILSDFKPQIEIDTENLAQIMPHFQMLRQQPNMPVVEVEMAYLQPSLIFKK